MSVMRERYPEFQYVFVRFMSEHLSDCSREFGGDLSAMLLLAVIGQSHITAMTSQASRTQGPFSYGLTALKLSDITGLPRETTRRKLAKLNRAGWVQQRSQGWFLIGDDPSNPNARQDLSELDQRGLERLARLHGDISRLLLKTNA
jgi:hypothetical protein